MSTFDLIETSHPDNLEVTFNDGFAIQFEFDNIFLPDSISDEPGSHGHIIYTIDPVEGLPLNTNVKNTAHIYFDFNPSIVTNTTESIMVDEFPTTDVKEVDDEVVELSVFPNPASRVLNFDSSYDEVKVYDVEGRLVMTEFNTDQISVEGLDQGVYLIKAIEGRRLYQKKVVVSR